MMVLRHEQLPKLFSGVHVARGGGVQQMWETCDLLWLPQLRDEPDNKVAICPVNV